MTIVNKLHPDVNENINKIINIDFAAKTQILMILLRDLDMYRFRQDSF